MGLIFKDAETTYVSEGGTVVLPKWVVEDSCDFEEIKDNSFLTEDSVKITDPEQFVYYFNKRSWEGKGEIKMKLSGKLDGLLYFSSEGARDEYIIQNKPVFSLKDVENYIRKEWFSICGYTMKNDKGIAYELRKKAIRLINETT